MFSGAQVSLYPMSGNFVGIILDAVKAFDPYRDRLRIETDDISTLLVGPPDVLFAAMRDLFVVAANTGEHCVLSAAVSRGCPGEPDDAICGVKPSAGRAEPLADRITSALAAVETTTETGQPAAAQFSLYVMGTGSHMDEIYGCIDFLKRSGTFDHAKNFCTRLGGDAGAVFATIHEAFYRFGDPVGHVTLDITVSANTAPRVLADAQGTP
ncbi:MULTISPECIES: YkoF family thiamine/hydroxymethylpyrimidine-binding protein [unclassified Rhizobium]|uniref:YkoF family thiamine/hydroxymethylpyrimidine-binding protein n=1 Tax=unclassified Rhizobium TaxID=2613769 RepID=UPI001A9927A5|nr:MULTISPECIES: YkoF family thiamine/hydroxymethylpyrimidine-binding protein [unclassified Rhizobium]MBX5158413.1 HMP/thiamine-binding protein [Rhizobium sp. NZLR8]MBX5163725.1 HMP/thiamine-binding protein [Rhizobium sp. NZLR4b]MBX5183062.1 HMP/thiamine-binding protein [Rhizobium sp. NZLR5]MBX5189372.1 HMP/thiamine-binding protein [Rhizobium sp. NZLR3b]MBX5196280.1 HMP/thiamine-binding protein [Rhizobium sp. NZLR10]